MDFFKQWLVRWIAPPEGLVLCHSLILG
jgi:hypothetical protein